MLTKNVHYSEKPGKFMITTCGSVSVVEFPLDVTAVTIEEGEEKRKEWIAESVYSLTTTTTPDLEKRVKKNYDAWLKKAQEIELQQPSLEDVIEAVNTLTDMILGGE